MPPLGGVIVGPLVVEAIRKGSGAFRTASRLHLQNSSIDGRGQCGPRCSEEQELFARVPAQDANFLPCCTAEGSIARRDVRGLGLLARIEFRTRQSDASAISVRKKHCLGDLSSCMIRGRAYLSTQGCVDGVNGDHILLAPPFIITAGMPHHRAGDAVAMRKFFSGSVRECPYVDNGEPFEETMIRS